MKKKIVEIEILRGFAIITVLIFHVTCYLFETNRNLPLFILLELINNLFAFGVPLFIFLSGFVLSAGYNHAKKDFSILQYYKKRFLTILPPYIIAAVIYMLLNSNFNLLNLFSPADISLHLWYIEIIIEFYFFYPLIRLIIHKFRNRMSYLLLISLILQISMILFNYFVILKYYSTVKQTFIDYIGYFILGVYVYENYDKIKKKIGDNKIILLFTTIIVISTLLQTYFFHVILADYGNRALFYHLYNKIFGSIFYGFMFLFLLNLAIIINEESRYMRKYLIKIGIYSFGIYLYHRFILDALFRLFILFGLDKNNLIFYIFLFLATIFLSLLLTYLISLAPFSKYIIGKTRNYNAEENTVIFGFENYPLLIMSFQDYLNY